MLSCTGVPGTRLSDSYLSPPILLQSDSSSSSCIMAFNLHPTNGTRGTRSKVTKQQDRRGFEVFFAVLVALISVGVKLAVHQRSDNNGNFSLSGALLILFSVMGLFIIERGTRPPRNDAWHYIHWKESNKSEAPTLVCLGDSLTHGTVSANWVGDLYGGGKATAYEIWCQDELLHVVNCGQNNLVTHTCLHERIDWALACEPNYVVLMIGTNDCRGIYNWAWRWQLETMWWTPERLSLERLECNVETMVKRLIQHHPQMQVGLCTLPPLGEDLMNQANTQIVDQANQRIREIAVKYKDQCTLLDVNKTLVSKIRRDQIKWPVRYMFVPAFLFSFPHVVLGTSLTQLAKLINNQVMFEGLHLNEAGGKIVTELVANWLRAQGLSVRGQ